MKMALHLCGLPPKNAHPHSSHEKNTRQIPIGRIRENYLAGTVNTVKVILLISKCLGRTMLPPEVLGDIQSLGSSCSGWLLAFLCLQMPHSCLCITPVSASMITLSLPLPSVNLSFVSYKDTPLDFGSTQIIQDDLIWISLT